MGIFSGIVFLNPSTGGVALPKVVSYKIRQDSSYVTRTTTVQR